MAKKYKYQITYFNPADEEGMREKTWEFGTLTEAKTQQEDLSTVWNTPREDIRIEIIKPTKECVHIQ